MNRFKYIIFMISTMLFAQFDWQENGLPVRQGNHIATTFHPEMHGDPLIHKYFLKVINGK